MQTILKKVFGSKSDREIKTLLPIVDEINQIAETLSSKSEVELVSRAQEIRKEITSLNMDIFTEKSKKVGDLSKLKKNLARSLTLMNQKKKNEGRG